MKGLFIPFAVLSATAIVALMLYTFRLLMKWRSFDNRTLVVLRKQWIPAIDLFGTFLLLLGIVVNFLLALFRIVDLGVGFAFGLAGYIMAEIIYSYSFYHLIKCPDCGHVLTKFKNGKNMPMKQAYTLLKNCSPCCNCGWTANTG